MAFTWLEKIGTDIVDIFKKAEPVVAEIQAVATPFENVFAPGLSTVINAAIQQISIMQALGAAAGTNTTGSGSVKLAAVIAAVAPQVAPTLASIGITNPTNAEYTNFINALVAAANAFEITQTPSPATTTVGNTTSTPSVVAPPTGAAVK